MCGPLWRGVNDHSSAPSPLVGEGGGEGLFGVLIPPLTLTLSHGGEREQTGDVLRQSHDETFL